MIAIGTPQHKIKHSISATFTSIEDIKDEDKQFYTKEGWEQIEKLREDQKKLSKEKRKEDVAGDYKRN
jgi:hypothetical protein